MFGPDSGISGASTRPRLLVGLGNPGSEYEQSRHNVGFAVLDALANRLGLTKSGLKAGGQRVGDWFRDPGGCYGLLWPRTYMNLSGNAVAAAMRQLHFTPDSIFVVCDDFNLELGAVRIRAEGSPGGHNGLKSIESTLGTRSYPRLRFGVGDPRGDTVDFVLSRFRRAERETVEESVEFASWAAEDWLRGASVEDLQTRYNRREP